MKISVIGAGNVGATCAQRVAEKDLANEVVLVDIIEGVPQGKGLDMWQSAPIEGFDTRVIGTNGYEETKGSGVVIITAGLARKPGMSRDDLRDTNAGIIKSISEQVAKYSPDAKIILVTNPLDVMTYVAFKTTGFDSKNVFGQAGVLDTARYRTFLSMELGISVNDIQAMVLGGHGDDMVPLLSYTTVSGIPITQLVPQNRLDEIIDRTRKGGGEIVKFLKTGSAFYAPSAAAVEMAEAVVRDKKRLLPCSAWLSGEFGIENTYAGVPVILGKDGVEKIVEIDLTSAEKDMLHASANSVKTNISQLNI
ncbi:MAG: malate dehydrogenase [Calditrichaeota bacterium]|nr:MAG: malate dehydrogenase [Calditrichota bacterium]